MNDEIDWDLLARYFSGECSEEEARRVRAWVEGNSKRKTLFEQLRQILRMTRESRSSGSWDTEALWDRIQQQTRQQEAEQSPTPTDSPSASVSNQDRRRTDRRRSARSRFSPWEKAVYPGAVALVIVVLGTLWLYGPWGKEPQLASASEAKTFATQKGERATIRLTDGTRIELNVNSRITVLAAFGKEKREVRLKGEAFFEVATDSTRPFVVHTGEATARVLGTAFDVRAYPEESETQVVVSEGRVALHSSHSSDAQEEEDGVVLTRHQLGRALRGGEQVVRKEPDLNQHLAWMDGQLVLDEASFEEVVRKLERWYDLKISLEKGTPVPSGHLNARFAKDQPLYEVLRVISTAFRIEYERYQKRRVTFHPPERSLTP